MKVKVVRHLKRVVRQGGLLIRHIELPSRVAALRGELRDSRPAAPGQESEGDIQQAAVLQVFGASGSKLRMPNRTGTFIVFLGKQF